MAVTHETGSILQVRRAKPRPVHGSVSSSAVKSRVYLAMMAFAFVYLMIGGRLVLLAEMDETQSPALMSAQDSVAASRPDLLDRNGEILATDIKTASLYAEPRRVQDVDETVEGLTSVLPDLDAAVVRRRLESRAGFAWLKRELTPDQANRIHNLGLPGIKFLPENKRFYPGGPAAGHIVGSVNVDNQGLSGIEKYVDDEWLADLQKFGFASDRPMEPVRLSVDLRVQHVVRDELVKAMERYRAIAAIGIVLDAKTGEVVAMSSLPDYDPNDRSEALDKNRLNRATGGVYEMGSVFKTFTAAMALDSGKVSINDSFDASRPDPGRGPYDPRFPRQKPDPLRAGNLHLFVQYRHREDDAGHRDRPAAGIPRPARFPGAPAHRVAGKCGSAAAAEMDRACGHDHFFRARYFGDADADRGRSCCPGQWRNVVAADLLPAQQR